MKKTRKLVILILALAHLLTGCQLIPAEEVYQKSPSLKEDTPVEYKLAYATRGDISDILTISCYYRSVREETLTFRVGDEWINAIYVAKGDMVKPGQVLAELEMDDIAQEEKRLVLQREQLDLSLSQLLFDKSRAIERHEIAFGADAPEALRALVLAYDDKQRALGDEIEYADMRLSELREDIKKRQIIATIDGTVMYVRTVREGDRSVEGERFMRVADTSTAVFVGETSDPECFRDGDLLEITVNKNTYPARVVTAEALGIDPVVYEEGEKTEVYLLPLELPPEIEDGDRGQVSVVRDAREDTLYVPTKAILLVDGREAVYGLDKYGLKTIVFIETGLVAGKETEVLSGLSEGDPVIHE